MVKLEELKKDALLNGIVPGQAVKVASVDRIGEDAISVFYRDSQGQLGERMLFRANEPSLSYPDIGRPWSFDGNGADFKLAAEAYRIHLAHLFDPLMAVHSSTIDPLPHQITAVYDAMLPKHPLRFLLADDPGAGKTIMAGLLIRELMVRGDLKRFLIVAPGNLVEQETVVAGIESKDFFGYASDKKDNRYVGLIFGKTGHVIIDENSVIVHKDAAQKQIVEESETPVKPGSQKFTEYGHTSHGTNQYGVADPGSTQSDDNPTVNHQKVFKRYHGSVNLNPIKASLDFSTITQEVIQHFSSILSTKVTITLDIEAISDNGFDDTMRRTVLENSRMLNFIHTEFEEE